MNNAVSQKIKNYAGNKNSVKGSYTEKTKIERTKSMVLKIMVLILVLFLGVEGLVYAFVIPCFSKPSIIYSGVSEQNEIAQSLSMMQGDPWIEFDSNKAVSILSSIPYVESVSVEKIFPNTVSVKIEERRPVAKTILSVNGVYKPFQIDKNCVIYNTNSDSYLYDDTLPLISGISDSDFKEGTRLPERYRALVNQIEKIQEEQRNFLRPISEIQLVQKEAGNYEVVLYPDNYRRVRVLIGHALDLDVLKRMLVVLDVVNEIEPDVVEVDLRYDSASYKIGEAALPVSEEARAAE